MHKACRGWTAAIILNLAMLAAALPLILQNHDGGRAAYDQNNFHLIAIRDFARQWPHFDFSDYPSATTPGYHLVLAAVDRFISDDVRLLRIAGTIFSIGLMATLSLAVARRTGPMAAIVLCLPCICSLYVLSSCAWLLPDNAGWWGVLAMLLIALRPRIDRWSYILGGLVLLILVIVRQGHLWVVAPFCVAAWIDGEQDSSTTQEVPARRWRRLSGTILAIAPAIAAVVWFAIIWHGMTPPNQRIIVEGTNAAAPAMALAVAGVLGVFFVPLIWTKMHSNRRVLIAIAGAISGGIIGAIPPTTYSVAEGRFSGIWNAVPHFGYVRDRSPLIVGLAMLGGAVIAVWLAAMPRRQRWIWAAMVIAFGATQVMTRSAFQRYDEPLILIAAALSVASLVERPPRWAWGGPILLAVILAGITVMSLR